MPKSQHYFKEIRFRQLRTLVNVSRLGSFASAAEKGKLSVPSVWNQVRALETSFGVSLVLTSSRGVELTAEGELLVERAIPLVKEFDELVSYFSSASLELKQKFVLATTASVLMNELNRPLLDFRRSCPEVELTFIDQPSMLSGKIFREGQADVAVIGLYGKDGENWSQKDFEIQTLTRYPFVLVASEGHPILERDNLEPKDLAKEQLIIPSKGSNARRAVENVFIQHDLFDSLHIVLGASHFELLAGHVSNGFGVSITSISPMIQQKAIEGDPRFSGLVFRDLSKLFGYEDVVCIRRIKRHYLLHEQNFWEILSKYSD